MNARTLLNAILATVVTFCLFAAVPVIAQDQSDESTASDTVLSEEATEMVSDAVASEEQTQTDENRERIIKEAVSALEQTRNALTALDEGRTDDALSSLALATGQLELLLAREPDLALAPTGVSARTHNVYGTREAIASAIEEAEELLRDGMVQAARRLLGGLASETVITVTNIPLATYPDAIKQIAPLIDEGKVDEARRGLQAALNTLVLTDHVIPLPIVRSEALIAKAEEMAAKEQLTAEEGEELSGMLAAAREELEMAQLLGYGESLDYSELFAQIDEVEARLEDGERAGGFVRNISESFTRLWASLSR